MDINSATRSEQTYTDAIALFSSREAICGPVQQYGWLASQAAALTSSHSRLPARGRSSDTQPNQSLRPGDRLQVVPLHTTHRRVQAESRDVGEWHTGRVDAVPRLVC